jgi:pimeloyl-ACP methyl ester carboxylesterase
LRIAIVVLLPVVLLIVGAAFLLHAATQPARDPDRQDPSELMLQAEDVRLTASDGVALAAWFVPGKHGYAPIILCHDLGGSRSRLFTAGVVLNQAGYPILLLDFRHHGESGGVRTTLGVNERLDVLAALEYLKGRRGLTATRAGGWGVGMGAYALALAATEAREFTALALDSIYPDVPAEADRLLRDRLPAALSAVVPAFHPFYDAYFQCGVGKHSVRNTLASLADRNVLFIAGSETPERFDEERRLYEALPEGPEGGRNLLQLRRSGLDGLYDEDRRRYDAAIVDFFRSALQAGAGPKASQRAVQVIER